MLELPVPHANLVEILQILQEIDDDDECWHFLPESECQPTPSARCCIFLIFFVILVMIRQVTGEPDCVEHALATLIADLKGQSASVLALPSFGAEPRSLGDAEKVTEARFYVVVLLEAVLKSLKHRYTSPRRRSVVRAMVF